MNQLSQGFFFYNFDMHSRDFMKRSLIEHFVIYVCFAITLNFMNLIWKKTIPSWFKKKKGEKKLIICAFLSTYGLSVFKSHNRKGNILYHTLNHKFQKGFYNVWRTTSRLIFLNFSIYTCSYWHSLHYHITQLLSGRRAIILTLFIVLITELFKLTVWLDAQDKTNGKWAINITWNK